MPTFNHKNKDTMGKRYMIFGVDFDKGFEPTFIELAITDETSDYQPDFIANVVN